MSSMRSEIAVIGGGPSGLAAAEVLQRSGFDVIVLEKGRLADHVSRFPTFMRFFSTGDLLELSGFPLIITQEKPTREEYLNYLRRFVRETGLDVRLGYRVKAIEGGMGEFRIQGDDRRGDGFELRAERVVLATGAYADPQLLGVPGEDLPKVSHYFTEVHDYSGAKVLVVGGKNSAVSTALELWRGGVDVTICHRRAEFGPVKYWLGPDIENRVRNGEIRAFMSAHVKEILPASVRIERESGETIEIENDFVLALTGYVPDARWLRSLGIHVDAATGRPEHDPKTLESNRPGMYMVGEMLSGKISGVIFIENSRTHGDLVAAHLKRTRAEGAMR